MTSEGEKNPPGYPNGSEWLAGATPLERTGWVADVAPIQCCSVCGVDPSCSSSANLGTSKCCMCSCIKKKKKELKRKRNFSLRKKLNMRQKIVSNMENVVCSFGL